MLTATSANGASALFKTIDQIGARTLPCRIESHEKSRDQRKPEREKSTGNCSVTPAFQWDVVAG